MALAHSHRPTRRANTQIIIHCNLAQRKVCPCFPLLPSGKQHIAPYFPPPPPPPSHNNKITFALAVREFGWMIY